MVSYFFIYQEFIVYIFLNNCKSKDSPKLTKTLSRRIGYKELFGHLLDLRLLTSKTENWFIALAIIGNFGKILIIFSKNLRL